MSHSSLDAFLSVSGLDAELKAQASLSVLASALGSLQCQGDVLWCCCSCAHSPAGHFLEGSQGRGGDGAV